MVKGAGSFLLRHENASNLTENRQIWRIFYCPPPGGRGGRTKKRNEGGAAPRRIELRLKMPRAPGESERSGETRPRRTPAPRGVRQVARRGRRLGAEITARRRGICAGGRRWAGRQETTPERLSAVPRPRAWYAPTSSPERPPPLNQFPHGLAAGA